jgi:hypothetical protein
MKARCGGPAMCKACKRERAGLETAHAAALAADEIVGYKIGDRVYHPADVVIIRRRDAP